MSERQKQILKAIIEEYISEAEPVGSKTLDEKYDFGIGPAMIRQEMSALEKEGYLAQPHTSAGRIPTDRAYRFYIAEEIKTKPQDLAAKDQRALRQAIKLGEGSQKDLLREVSRAAAEVSRELSVTGLVNEELFFTHGFTRLMSAPELQVAANVQHLLQFVEELDKCFNTLWRHMLPDEPAVFIGEENPIREIQDFTVITGRFNLRRPHLSGARGFISIIGPRRMDYRKNVALVNYVSGLVSSRRP